MENDSQKNRKPWWRLSLCHSQVKSSNSGDHNFAGLYGAVTLDTNQFCVDKTIISFGAFEKTKHALKSFDNVIMSEVTKEELIQRLSTSIEHSARIMRSEAKQLRRQNALAIQKQAQIEKYIDALKNPDDTARRIVEGIVKDSGIEIVSVKNVTADEVLRLYKDLAHPFSKTKRNEFKDAIALLSLRNWARDNKVKVLAISSDKDWSRFASVYENREHIDVKEDLIAALATLQDGHEIAKKAMQNFLANDSNVSQKKLRSSIQRKVREWLNAEEIIAFGSSFFEFESIVQGFWVNKILYEDRKSKGVEFDFSVDSVTESEIAVRLEIRIHMAIHLKLEFLGLEKYRDSSQSVSARANGMIKLFVRPRNSAPDFNFDNENSFDDTTIAAAEIFPEVGWIGKIKFGNVDPDFGNDDDSESFFGEDE